MLGLPTIFSSKSTSTAVLPFAFLAVLGIVQGLTLSLHGYPCPRGDDSWYKSPAAEFASNGVLRIPGMTGAVKQAQLGFAQYPPIYQLVFASWYLAFGFSLTSTLLCSHLIHSLSALAIASVGWKISKSIPETPKWMVGFVVIASGLFHLGNLSYFDRPEDLAIIFFVMLFHVVESSHKSWSSIFIRGGLISLAGLTAPWVGVLAVFFLVMTESVNFVTSQSTFRESTQRIVLSGLISMIPVAVWWIGMNSIHPGIVEDQFVEGAMHLQGERPEGILNKMRVFITKSVVFDVPRIAVLIGIVFIPFRWKRSGLGPSESALVSTAIIGMTLVISLRPTAYTYLGATLVLLIPTFILTLSNFLADKENISKIGAIAVFFCLLISQRDVIQSARSIWIAPEDLSASVCYREICEIIPPEDLVGVTSRHWYAIQGRNPWRDLYFVSTLHVNEIEKCEWLITYPGLGTPECISKYHVIRNKSFDLQNTDTYAYTIWKNNELRKSLTN